ncbi:MAG TPA: tetrahydrofolate dehydrogenase/cyclohydrolase catalytic domain-containing protein, partial [Inquilinus sp.]
MSERDLTGRAVADAILAEVAAEVSALGEAHWPPKLVSITVGDESAVDVYVRNQRRTAEGVGIAFETRR